MRLLKEIYHQNGINREGKTIQREAVRGILLSGKNLLLIYSTKNGDYKFPGGGVKGNESHEEALAREILEECGTRIIQVTGAFGKMIEYDQPLEPEYDVFRMTSFYYYCSFDSEVVFGKQQLDDYEEDLGFRPTWVDIAKAIQANQVVLRSNNPPAPHWTMRDTFVLEQLEQVLTSQG